MDVSGCLPPGGIDNIKVDKSQERFMRYVKKENDCWKWLGSKAITGYCNFFYKGKTYLAHRASLLIFNKVKQLAPGLQVAHSCPNKDCVNPDHLSEKTRSENNGTDKRRHKMDLSGERCHFSKLTWEQVDKIRKVKCSNKLLADIYSVTSSTIASIRRNKTWIKADETPGE